MMFLYAESVGNYGESARARTEDNSLKRGMLYQLSYGLTKKSL
jgi:hypothetical protein